MAYVDDYKSYYQCFNDCTKKVYQEKRNEWGGMIICQKNEFLFVNVTYKCFYDKTATPFTYKTGEDITKKVRLLTTDSTPLKYKTLENCYKPVLGCEVSCGFRGTTDSDVNEGKYPFYCYAFGDLKKYKCDCLMSGTKILGFKDLVALIKPIDNKIE